MKIQNQVKFSGKSIEMIFKEVDEDEDAQNLTFLEFTTILKNFK